MGAQMLEEDGLIVAYILDGQGGGEKIDWPRIRVWTPDQGLLWIHLNYAAHNVRSWLMEDSGLDKINIRTLLADDSRPCCRMEDEGLLLSLRGVNLNPGQEPEDMVSVKLWIDEHRIISTRQRKLLSIDDLRNDLEMGRGPRSLNEFLISMNNNLLNRIGDVLDIVDDQMNALEEQVMHAKSRILRGNIADVRRQAILIRRYLSPQREALYHLQIECKSFKKFERNLVKESTDRTIRYIEDLDAIRDRASVTQEELSGRLSEQMNQRMYVLSIATVIFLPLSFITGLLGINVGGIPGSSYQWAFLIVCLLLLLLTGLIVVHFKRSKWM